MTRLRFAVIPTHDRPQDFQDCLEAIWPQVDRVVVVSHSAPYMPGPAHGSKCTVLRYEWRVPNISDMWNLGLDQVHRMADGRPYDVAVLNDDAIVPVNWFTRVTWGMRQHKASAGCVKRADDHRMAGHAFILDGDVGLRADPQFRWWYGDDDLERRAGKVAFVPGEGVEHRHPNSTTVGVLREIADADKQRFERKWGA